MPLRAPTAPLIDATTSALNLSTVEAAARLLGVDPLGLLKALTSYLGESHGPLEA